MSEVVPNRQYGISNSFHHECVIDSSHEECRRIQEEMLTIAAAFDFSERELFAIHLVTEESLMNAVMHGNRSDPTRKITVAFTVARTEFRIRITDEGTGFDPDQVPDPTAAENLDTPSGRGLTLMRAFMTDVRHNRVGNSVEMWLHRGDSRASV